MPIEEYAEEGLKKIPNLDLAQALFTLQTKHTTDEEKDKAKLLLETQITEHSKKKSDLFTSIHYVAPLVLWRLLNSNGGLNWGFEV